MNHFCRKIYSGDMTRCETCGKEWDTNDPCPPQCPYDEWEPVSDWITIPILLLFTLLLGGFIWWIW